ncbi:MAG: DNA circularization N-terminal domain-containing protein [Sphingomonadaceae bacterium]|nr:DNA circularization N-terminal domain-containing protein [Sphingomonadaceae bacterium]MBV9098015.1 DNA circularization N-terminal domain-containing protein [Frankiaceae bacterium]
MALFHDGLLPASFRGVPFAVRSNATQLGRRLAVHQYPGRDTPWVEDLGRGARRIHFAGFIVSGDVVLGGTPVAAQRALLIAAAEKKDPGTLTHPTLGILQVACEALTITDPIEAGGYAEVEFTFVESGKQTFPSLLSLAGANVGGVALTTIATVLSDAAAVLAVVRAANPTIVIPATPWASAAVTLSDDATALNRLAAGLPGDFGRFARGGNVGFAGSTATYASDTTLAALIADASAQRVAVRAAAAAFIAATDPTTAPAAAAALVAALLAACADPADALRLLAQLVTVAAGSDPVAGSTADLMRRLAVVALAEAAAAYQPSSYDDAFAKLAIVTGLIDAELTVAGDQGLDATFNALRALRVAIVQDLRTRGGSLARIRRYDVGVLPAVALGQRLYRDATRADQLIAQTDPVSPLFMPASFEALAA